MNDKENNSSRLTQFVRRNGVFLALAISVLLMGAVVIAGVTQKLSKPDQSDRSDTQQPVEQTVSGEKDTRITSTTSTSLTTTNTLPTTEQESPQLYLLPLTNTVQKSFSSDGPMYCETMKDWRLHLGVDFAGEEGQTVKTVTDGIVVAVENNPLWGGTIVIDHGVGVLTRYCGVDPIVRVGDEVEIGEKIGTLLSVPCECAQKAHLHLEMSVDGQPIDPVAAIGLEVRYADTTE